MQQPIDVVYDVETFPNVFTCAITPLDPADDSMWFYEISERVNHAPELAAAICGRYFRRMFGFNNLNFDYPIIHRFLDLAHLDAASISAVLFQLCNEIIGAGSSWSHRVKPWQVLVPQVDLFLIHHFDNVARRTGLKALEFAMRAPSIEDMPFKPGTWLTPDQIPVLLHYNGNDTRETKRFAHKSANMIAFREALGADHLNDNDTKIGKSFFIKEMEARQPGVCYNPDRSPRQTWRSSIALGDVILPYLRFDRPEFQNVLNWLRAETIEGTKNVFPDVNAIVDGFRFDFGTGGIHGSVSNQVVRADDGFAVVDLDVTAYYPSIAIVNNLAPAHLGAVFVQVYRELRDRRVLAKRTGDKVQADALKLANNGVYGDSNNIYGPFYDPAYTMAITINGQLLLCMLAEKLMAIPGLQMIQINTDGMTVRLPRGRMAELDAACAWWQWATALELERADYEGMWIRDVNNYLARTTAGKMKRKGAYDYELKLGDQIAWHRDFSGLVIPRAAEAALVDDQDPEDFIEKHTGVDPWDFMFRAKVNRGSRLLLGDGTELPATIRYFISTDGQPLVKEMPALKGQTVPRRIGIHAEGQALPVGARKNYHCSVCGLHFLTKYAFEDHNRAAHSWRISVRNQFAGDITGIDLRFYVKETEKLLLT